MRGARAGMASSSSAGGGCTPGYRSSTCQGNSIRAYPCSAGNQLQAHELGQGCTATQPKETACWHCMGQKGQQTWALHDAPSTSRQCLILSCRSITVYIMDMAQAQEAVS